MQKKRLTICSIIRQHNVQVVALLVFVGLVFSPLFNNLFTNWDEIYILHNPYLKSLSFENVRNIFSVYYSGNYHPLTLISLAIDYKTGGMHPLSYQITNLLLHICNTWLVYVFIKNLLARSLSVDNSQRIALIAALLFGIHTLQVESVAWISERKNVLYAFFFLLALISYLKYLDKTSLIYYVLSIVLFILSLLSKGMAVPLAFCIIIVDYVAGRNLLQRKVILEKIPFLIIALVFGYIAIRAQHAVDAIREDSQFSVLDRVSMASYGFMEYLIKLCCPVHLSAFYPYPAKTGTFLPVQYYAYVVLVISLLIILGVYARRNRMMMFGALFFIANISIVIQLLPVGDAVMSDRYVYIASIGFFVIIGYVANLLWHKSAVYRTMVLLFTGAFCLFLGVKTYQRVSIWKDSMTLWSDAIQHYPDNNDRAFQNMGIIYYEQGNYNKAMDCYNQVLHMHLQNKTAYAKAYSGIGQVKQALKDRQGAMENYNASVSIHPTFEGYYNRAVLKMELNDTNGALADLEKASQVDSLRTEAFINKGAICYQNGDFAEALQSYDRVLRIDPENARAYLGSGQTKQAANDFQGALDDFNKAISLDPSYDAYLDRAVLKMNEQDFDGALADLDKAARINPLRPEVYINKGVLAMNAGNVTDALREFDNALDADANDYRAYLCRAYAKISIKDYISAVADLDLSIHLHPNAEAYYYRGLAKIGQGHGPDACSDLHQSALMGYSAAQAEIRRNCK